MKILYIVPYVPNLIRVRPFNLIRHLSLLGHEVTVATVLSDPAEEKDIANLKKECAQVIAIEMPTWRSLVNSLSALLQQIPMQARYSWHPGLFKQILGILDLARDSCPFDVIHIEHLRGIEYGLRLLSRWGEGSNSSVQPIVWDSVDCISSLMHQTTRRGSSLKSRMIAMLEYKNTARYECRGVQLFDRLLVTSPVDQMELANTDLEAGRRETANSREKIDVLPNGVDLDYFQPGIAERFPDTIVITGKMSYHANAAMVQYLVTEIMPLVWARRPEVRLQIVGKDPPPSMLAMGENPLITVTGTVSDIRPYLQQATVAVVPITYGTGIQNKILEAMACATPVIVSAKAAKSLLAVPDQDFLVVDSTNQFAEAILALLDDPLRCSQLGTAGRTYVENNHDWVRIAGKLVNLYENTITNKKAVITA